MTENTSRLNRLRLNTGDNYFQALEAVNRFFNKDMIIKSNHILPKSYYTFIAQYRQMIKVNNLGLPNL